MKTLSIGEILWDVYPDKKVWGGAPANFIYHTAQLGADAMAVSAVGDDELGAELTRQIRACGINLHADVVPHPTGIAQLSLDDSGTASYAFNHSCAWDYIPFTDQLADISAQADMITFGTLAQRHAVSRETIRKALELRKAGSKVLFDVNIRLEHFSPTIVEESLAFADIMKLNNEETALLEALLGMPLPAMRDAYGLEMIIQTLGGSGSMVIADSETSMMPAKDVEVVDTVGAGDAFAAAFMMSYLQGGDICDAQAEATSAAAAVCEHSGATK